MGLFAAGQITTNAIAAVPVVASSDPSIPVVIFTGLTLVFGILILLYLVLLLQGKIFSALDRKKQEQEKEKAEKAAEQKKAQMPPEQSVAKETALKESVEPEMVAAIAAATAGAIEVQDGVSPEVVAAIAAAVHECSEGQYAVQSVGMAGGAAYEPIPTKSERRGRWGMAGVMSNTEPF